VNHERIGKNGEEPKGEQSDEMTEGHLFVNVTGGKTASKGTSVTGDWRKGRKTKLIGKPRLRGKRAIPSGARAQGYGNTREEGDEGGKKRRVLSGRGGESHECYLISSRHQF